MAIFGRNSSRQRLQRAAQESLQIPASNAAVDCAPWVTSGLWPAELSVVTAETALIVKYLKTDLQRIVDSANEELENIRCAGLVEKAQLAEEARVMNDARAFAVRRVESTVRQLHNRKFDVPTGHALFDQVANAPEKTTRCNLAPSKPEPEPGIESPGSKLPPPPTPAHSEPRHAEPEPFDRPDPGRVLEPLSAETYWVPAAESVAVAPPCCGPAPDLAGPANSAPKHALKLDDTGLLEDLSSRLQEMAPLTRPIVATPVTELLVESAPTHGPSESDRERLERVLKFVARQEPGLRWAVGIRERGGMVLVTDLAHGWIPPGLTLPADAKLLEPGRRKGTAATLLGEITQLASYAPGDPLGWASDYEITDISSRPRELPPVDDLGWVLSEATHWRDGLPRMVNTLARAGAAGTGVDDAEIEVLRVYLDTSRYQVLAQYPDVDLGLLLNCLLLAATDAIATEDIVTANYHFAWFQLLSSPPVSSEDDAWRRG